MPALSAFSLLDEVHRLIEKKDFRFLLTGSSARKLRKKGVNLLGGRARVRRLHPFSAFELKDKFALANGEQIDYATISRGRTGREAAVAGRVDFMPRI